MLEEHNDSEAISYILHENWNAPRPFSAKKLMKIGESEIAKQMALKSAIEFDTYGQRAIEILEKIENDETINLSEIKLLIITCLEDFGHYRHAIFNLHQLNFQGIAIDALLKLNMYYDGYFSGHINDSLTANNTVYEELSDRFPEYVAFERYCELYKANDKERLKKEFPEKQISNEEFLNPISVRRSVTDSVVFQDEDRELEDRLWLLQKMQECYKTCQTCPDYQFAKTENIMTGIRTLIHKLTEEHSEQPPTEK